jgi:anthranilate synthase component I
MNHSLEQLNLFPQGLPRKPVSCLVDGVDDFFTLFKKIEQCHDVCFFLESLGADSHISRYSLIGFSPQWILSARENTLQVRDSRGHTENYRCDNPYFALRSLIPQDGLSRKYSGGLTGFLGYDAMNYFEPGLDIHTHPDFESFKFGLYDDGLLLDKMTGEVEYFYYHHNRLDDIKRLMATPFAGNKPLRITALGDTLSQADHAQAVAAVKRDIVEGKIFQCEVGFKSRYQLEGDSIHIYEALRDKNPSPQMYYLKFCDQKIIGASPELLFRLRQGEMETYPLAGTTRRGETPAEDQALARQLLRDPKEIAEHNMLVDLHRNDIGRVAQFGTVKVRNLMDIKRFSHVQHISSEIVGILAAGQDMFSALASNFPAGTLTGAPKIEAMKIINRLEAEGRGPYGGAVGHFGFNGDCTFAIPIRTLFVSGNSAYVQTCGGNVYDSNPDDEYLEIQRKLAGTHKVLELFMGDTPRCYKETLQ